MIIPIVYASDDNYARYMMLSMYSLVCNSDDSNQYVFYLLVPEKFSEDNVRMIDEYVGRFDNAEVNYVRMDSKYDAIANPIERLSSAALYRLSLPSILNDVEKCIYIDCDTIVEGDISDLWNEDIGDSLIAGVKAHNLIRQEKMHRSRLEWKKSDPFIYVNSGVLLINLDEMRKAETESACMKLIDKDYYFSDQDILNVACKGRVHYLPCRYNVRPYYIGSTGKRLQGTEDGIDIEKALKDPVIYHYAVTYKPWHNVRAEYADHWLKYAMTDEMKELFPETCIIAENSAIADIISRAADKDMELFSMRNKLYKREKEIEKYKRKIAAFEEENQSLKAKTTNKLFSIFRE